MAKTEEQRMRESAETLKNVYPWGTFAENVLRMMDENAVLHDLLKLYSYSLRLATDDDKEYAMGLLLMAEDQLDIPIPAISCELPNA